MNKKKLFFGFISLLGIALSFTLIQQNNAPLGSKIEAKDTAYTTAILNHIDDIKVKEDKQKLTASASKNDTDEDISINPNMKLAQIQSNHFQTLESQQNNIFEDKAKKYLALQKEYNYMHQGGVRAKLEMQRRQREHIFRKKYEQMTMPQKHAQRNAFLKQQQSLQLRKQQILRLREKQKLQQDIRGKE